MLGDVKTIATVLFLSGIFIGLVEVIIACRFMESCEDWQRVGMLACGIVIITLVAWQVLNAFVPNVVASIIPDREFLGTINFKWCSIVNAVENFLFGIILYSIVSSRR